MENSVKAIYMAAGVLIGVLILTTFVFVFRKGGQFLEAVDGRKASEDIAAYNSKFVIYNKEGIDVDEDGDIDDNYNTIFDVVTACNLAYHINKENLYDEQNCLEIQLTVDGNVFELTHENKLFNNGSEINIKPKELIKYYGQVEDSTYDDYKYKFKGTVEYDSKDGKIIKIIFEKIS